MAYLAADALGYLQRARSHGRLGHAYLVSGSDRADQESLAAKLFSLVSGKEVDTVDAIRLAGGGVVQPESKSRRIQIDQMRELERTLHLGGGGADGRRFAVIVDADRMQPQASNAFLKTLEEPPPGTLLVLLTTAPELLLETVRSRCIRIPLRSAARKGAREPSPVQRDLLELLSAAASKAGDGGNPYTFPAALTVKSQFAALLKKLKDGLVKEYEAALKEEVATYKQTTEGDWLSRREKYYQALAESRYLKERAALLGTLASWFGDVLSQKLGRPQDVEFPQHAASTAALSTAEDVGRIIERIRAVDFLRQHLETNVQEALALEVAFLKILG